MFCFVFLPLKAVRCEGGVRLCRTPCTLASQLESLGGGGGDGVAVRRIGDESILTQTWQTCIVGLSRPPSLEMMERWEIAGSYIRRIWSAAAMGSTVALNRPKFWCFFHVSGRASCLELLHSTP